jgi:CubicO group peptidase (beta-lactamase class C family)
MTRLALERPLINRPGERYEYCTVAFYLLAALIERVTGATYREHLARRVLDPLGMISTFDPRRANRPIVAVRGVGIENRFVRFLMLRFLANAALPGGGLFGTLDDLLRFGAALLRPEPGADGRPVPVSTATFEEMTRDQLNGAPGSYDGEDRPVHFGLGWGKPTLMFDLPGSKSVVSHGGATGTRLWIDPEAGLVFVFFTNRWAADRTPEAAALRATYRAMEAR